MILLSSVVIELNISENLIDLRTVKVILVSEIRFEMPVEIGTGDTLGDNSHLLIDLVVSSGREMNKIRGLVVF